MRAWLRPAIAAISFGISAHALAADAWTPVGPRTGDVQTLAMDPADPATLFAGTFGGGLYRTSDGGAMWSLCTGVPRDSVVEGVAFDPAHPRTVWAMTRMEGAYRSTDGGASWKRVLSLERQQWKAIAIDPKGVAYVAADTTGPAAGVHRSADGGATWKHSDTGFPSNFRLSALAVDPKAPATIYAGTLSMTDPGGDTITYRFRGLRAKKSCVDRKSVRKCARTVRW